MSQAAEPRQEPAAFSKRVSVPNNGPINAPNNTGAVAWSKLTNTQQTSLAPLQSDWQDIDGVRQRKWLELASRMSAMPEAERIRVQERMAQWAQLTPEKRNQARQQFLQSRQLPAPQRQARWEAYQSLSAQEKQALVPRGVASEIGVVPQHKQTAASKATSGAEAASRRPPLLDSASAQNPSVARSMPSAPTMSALQAKPGATTRPLTSAPTPPAHHHPGMPKIVAKDGFVDPSTLLPKRGPQGAAVTSALVGDSPTKP